ncbi:MAG: thioredoxin domain-containing protein [Chthoniobacterales bacterium]|nr:thioredoxin domain-containing protein [Chthoniobacterales bacterium]
MNHLANASSPYLRQHATNPVEWYPWGEVAFARAREEQKPIFLSIGYSTCHWCHVMAHESFEDQAIAALLNNSFISIKVDREERPDVDRLYMSYVQALTGRGGWPLSVWLTPELKPFFGGTYFPPETIAGRVGFPSVLLQLEELWREHRPRLEAEANQAMQQLEELTKRDVIRLTGERKNLLHQAYHIFSDSFDERLGGFGMAPKFPRPSVFFFLLHYANHHQGKESQRARDMVLFTLSKMAAGGIHDHLGGGFHRYSVDRRWQVPHFEKMLYDQAQLSLAYLEAFQLTQKTEYSDVVHAVLKYVLRDMTSPEGGFYSAEDADSMDEEGIQREGAFYAWSEKEIQSLLSQEEATLITTYYQLSKEGNVPQESDPHDDFVGKNIFIVNENKELTKIDQKKVASARAKLFLARKKRAHPHRDDKIQTSWNALMISALVRTGMAFHSEHYLTAARRAATFIQEHLYDPSSGQLRHSWHEGNSEAHGFAEDYAFLIQGLLDLYESTSEQPWFQWAKKLQGKMDDLFLDERGGAYFSSAAGDPHLLMRMKEEYDGAEPSANSIAALNHLRFARLLPESKGRERAAAIINASAASLQGMPTALPQLLVALSEMEAQKTTHYRCDDFRCEEVSIDSR